MNEEKSGQFTLSGSMNSKNVFTLSQPWTGWVEIGLSRWLNYAVIVESELKRNKSGCVNRRFLFFSFRLFLNETWRLRFFGNPVQRTTYDRWNKKRDDNSNMTGLNPVAHPLNQKGGNFKRTISK